MINFRDIEINIVDNIKSYVKCEVISANQTAPVPQYPYISYTVITPMVTNNGTYGEFVEEIDGKNTTVYRKEFQQIWSFTVQSDDDMQSKTLAMQLYDYLDKIGSIQLADNNIVIQRIGNITNRDNLLTIDYEYRNGFDVTFAFMNEITGVTEDEISDIKFNNTN